MAQHEVDRVLRERMRGTDRWENRVALGWTVDDLDGNEARNAVREAAQRGRLVDPGSTDPVEIVRRLGVVARDGALVRAAVVSFGRSGSLLPEYPRCRLRRARCRGVDRTPLWACERLEAFRQRIIQRAGRVTRPKGQDKVTMSANDAVRGQPLHVVGAGGEAA